MNIGCWNGKGYDIIYDFPKDELDNVMEAWQFEKKYPMKSFIGNVGKII